MSWQYVEMFDIGLAEENYYKSKMNIYPTTVSRIELNIQNGNTDFNNSNNYSRDMRLGTGRRKKDDMIMAQSMPNAPSLQSRKDYDNKERLSQ